MMSLDNDNIKFLSIWLSPLPNDIVTTIRNRFVISANSLVYFLDATNSFPLREFQSTIPLDNKDVYDNIIIKPCLDLQELMQVVNKIIQQLTINGHKKPKSTNSHKPIEVLLIIDGLGIMFQNTQIRDSISISHLLVRDILLKLRLVANNPQSDGSYLKSLIMFPKDEIRRYGAASGYDSSNKRVKGVAFEGNTLAQYIAKFYADNVI